MHAPAIRNDLTLRSVPQGRVSKGGQPKSV